MTTDKRSEDQAKAQLDSIKEMVQALRDAGDDEQTVLEYVRCFYFGE